MRGAQNYRKRHFKVNQEVAGATACTRTAPFGTTGTQYNVRFVVRVDSPRHPLILLYRPNGERVHFGVLSMANGFKTESTLSPLGVHLGPLAAHSYGKHSPPRVHFESTRVHLQLTPMANRVHPESTSNPLGSMLGSLYPITES